jgi:hypothetical protein
LLRPGDSVFYCDNAADRIEYGAAVEEIVRSLGLVPIIYCGARTRVEHSSLDREIRDDLYRSKLAVVRLGPSALLDNWALLERETGPKHGVDFLIYSMGTVPDADLAQVAIVVSTLEDFSARLRQDLTKLIG